jgi:hypothetical protein
MPLDAGAAPAEANVSVGGVLLLSTMAVILAILGAMLLISLVLAAWWLLSHIPIPAPVHHLLAALGLA